MSDQQWMAAAIALSERGRGLTAPNPHVGCIIVNDGEAVGEGWTQRGGRPHAEAVALEQAGARARGATAFVTLEPCAHASARGPACAPLLAQAGITRLVAAVGDPDPRTDGRGFDLLRTAGIEIVRGVCEEEAERMLAGFLTRHRLGRPHVTLKLSMSIDGKIALPSGESRWITGPEARADAHIHRAFADMILVGRGTYEADDPALNVRAEGLEDRSPHRALLTRGQAPDGWVRIGSPEAIATLTDINELLVEGGAGAAAAFLAADLVDRLLVYRAPIVIGEGKGAVGDIGLHRLGEAHGRWECVDSRALGIDRRDVYERRRRGAES